jgi:hypothetical protein
MAHVQRVATLVVAALAMAGGAKAQQPAQRQVDSLAAEVRALEARLDSLRAALGGGAPAPADTGLAALRAAAAAAAGPTGADTTRDTTTTTRVEGHERNQAQLNPEIGATGDVRASAQTGGGNNFDPREFEIGFQSALDPYSHTKIFVSLENDEVSVEEGYAYWTGIPGRLRFDIGIFRQQFGELNRWHLHALPETEYPLVLRAFFGDDGLTGTGVSLYRAFGGLGTHELTGQVTLSRSGDELFAGGNRPSYLLHLLNFWQLSPATYAQLGLSGLYGTNPDSSLSTAVGGLEFRLTWRPPSRALYRDWTLRGELLALRKDYGGAVTTKVGGYLSTTYKLDQRWIVGARWDYVEDPRTGLTTQEVVPSLTLWQSEWVFLRAQYTWAKAESLAATNQLALQAVWAIGPHKHETY